MSDKPIKASCLCGEVKFEVTPPIIFFQYCHCSRCRKATGSAHGANLFIKKAQLEWMSGEELVKRYEMPDAKFFCTGWCDKCGSALPWLSRNGKYYLVPAGALDEDPRVKPTRSIHWASKGEWYDGIEGMEKFEGEPG
jgi:hypothetical protein